MLSRREMLPIFGFPFIGLSTKADTAESVSLEENLIKCLLKQALNRNILIYDSSNADFSLRLISLMKVVLRRNCTKAKLKMILLSDNQDVKFDGVDICTVKFSLMDAYKEYNGSFLPEGKTKICLAISEDGQVLLGAY